MWYAYLFHLGQPISLVASTFGVGKSTVYDIVKSEDKLKTFQKEVEDGDCIKKSEKQILQS